METRTSTLFLLLCLLCFSTAEDIYHPVELFRISCGNSSDTTSLGGPNWIGDTNTKLLSDSDPSSSVSATPLTQPTKQGPYTSARLSSHSQFTYSFPLTKGPKFLRLFFYSTSFKNFNRSNALFSVKSGQYTLLQDFNASVNADADADQGDTFMREFCINVEDGQRLNVTFIPSTTPDSYAFINGIEVVSMPYDLYYTGPENPGFPVIGSTGMTQLSVENNYALETTYRLNVGGRQIPPASDTGMLRTWDADDDYLKTESGPSVDYGHKLELTFSTTVPNYTAPDEVYRTLRNMGTNATANMLFNMTWELPVDSGFNYLLRLHFCELDPLANNIGERVFYIFIDDQVAQAAADVLQWTDGKKGVPVVRSYIVIIPQRKNQKRTTLSLKLHPQTNTGFSDAMLNAIELFKISNPQGSLAGPNPDPPLQIPSTPTDSLRSPRKKNGGTVAEVAGGVLSSVVLISLVVAFFLIKRRKTNVVDDNKGSKHGGSSNLPTNLCRHFSIEEIRIATNNFDENFVIGVGGFGHVYKGYVDGGLTPVAIKRLKQGSQQGANEFMNEIEMLSRLRHVHLVSLIGYCYESNEMVLVYDFMARGTLRDHLYDKEDNDDPPLSWKQRLQICLGAARGLHYLHTGAKHMIIHRDVKSMNILLDEKWVAKVSDFGLSRLGPTGVSMTHVSTVVKGSIGYLDPEYYKRQRLTEKSDVYSFGVVLLEVLCGRQPLLRTVEKRRVSLVDWAKLCHKMGTLREIVDPAIKGEIAPEGLGKFGEVAMSCLLDDGTQRPSMNDVVGVLEFVLQLQEENATGTYKGMVEERRGNYEDGDYIDMFSSTISTGVSMTTSDEDHSCGTSKESHRLITGDVFSEIHDPKGR